MSGPAERLAEIHTVGGGAAEAPEPARQSLVDSIVNFDPRPYLDGSLLSAWDWLQQYPLLFATLLVLIGYGLGRLLKWIIHIVLERIAKNHISELDYQIAHYLTSPILQTALKNANH